MSLPEAFEAAASALPEHADAIRPANGDPTRLLEGLDAPSATAVLAWLLDARPEAGEELAMAWSDLEAGEQPLRALDAATLGKAGRKALRRVQHRLRSRGIAIEPAAPAPRVATLPKLDDALDIALVSPPDPTGAQLVVVIESNPSGGARIFQGVVDVERGILDFQVMQAPRSQARQLVRRLEDSERLGATLVPRVTAAALLARAADAQPSGRALPQPFGDWRSRVARPPVAAATPGELARAAFEVEPEPSLLREVADAVGAGRHGPWPPPDFAELRALAEKLREATQSKLLVDDAQRRAQFDALLSDALEARYAGVAAERTATRFEESAYAAWKRGDEEAAKRLLGAARAFREQPARENPVARALLERALEPLLAALQEEQAASPLVRP